MRKQNALWACVAAFLILTGCGDKARKDAYYPVIGSGAILALAFSPDGKTLASGHYRVHRSQTEARLWDVKTGEKKATLEGHHNRIGTLTFSPDGKTLASGASDRTARLWSAETGEPIQTFTTTTTASGVPAWRIVSAAFAADGKNLAAIDNFGGVIVWNPDTGSPARNPIQISTMQIRLTGIDVSAFSPDGQLIAVNEMRGKVLLMDAVTGEHIRVMKGHSYRIHALAFSPDSSTLASGSFDWSILLWDPYTGKRLKRLKGHESRVLCLAFSPDGKTLASGCISPRKETIDWLRLKGERGKIMDLKHGDLSEETLRLWDVKTGAHLKTLDGHKMAVWSVAFSPDGKTLASGGADQTVRIWNVKTGELIKTLK
ncbi:MAG: WD40 repeat domain-containing protein [Candidatus Poribacteria bacterium]|nr:WD40 repeat domain-containing protein [Candidatus Poribacteria bacterium]